MRVEENTPTARCVHCGRRLKAKTYDELWGRYTQHVTSDHDKPATRREAMDA